MKPKDFAKLLKRDRHCLHCGLDDDTLIVQHRANRGSGGSKQAEKASNLIVLCSAFNGLIESDADAAAKARRFGWKLSRYDHPANRAVYDVVAGEWYLLDDNFTKRPFIG